MGSYMGWETSIVPERVLEGGRIVREPAADIRGIDVRGLRLTARDLRSRRVRQILVTCAAWH